MRFDNVGASHRKSHSGNRLAQFRLSNHQLRQTATITAKSALPDGTSLNSGSCLIAERMEPRIHSRYIFGRKCDVDYINTRQTLLARNLAEWERMGSRAAHQKGKNRS